MAHLPEDRLPPDLQEVVDRLRRDRPEPGPIELDRIKLTAMKRARREQSSGRPRRRGLMRSGLMSPVLSIALVIVGLVAIAGATTGSPVSLGGSKGNSSHVEYCKQESKSSISSRSGSSSTKSKDECEESCDNEAKASSSSSSRSNSKSKSGSTNKSKKHEDDDCDDD
jgi:cytoskeletal protein RodZ